MLTKNLSRTIKTLAFAGLLAIGAADAKAGFSTVNNPGSVNEMGHAQILSGVYGGSFSQSGANFSSGTMTATRIEDSSSTSAIMDLITGNGGSDQCFTNGVISARAIARFAGSEQTLGALQGQIGGSFQELFTVSGTGLNVSGGIDGLDLCGKTVRFARGAGASEMYTTLDTENYASADMVVSYHLTGGGIDKWVLFFEDAGVNYNSDFDFNDLVVEITASPAAVPLPPAAWTGLATLVAGGLFNARTRLRQLLA